MNINDIMLRDMEEAKAKAEAERAERDERAIRRADKITNVGCALLSVLAVATLLLIAVALYWDKAHKRALFGAQRPFHFTPARGGRPRKIVSFP